jgi:uncharacterized protein
VANNKIHAQQNNKRTVAANDTIRKAKSFILMGKYFGDGVVLRWAPKTTEAWEKANTTGYEVYRFDYDVNDKQLLSHPVQLTAKPVKPLTLDEWKQQFKPADTSAAMAAELLYGKKMETTGKRGDHFSWEDNYTQHADMNNRLGLALLNAEIHPEIATGMGWKWEDKTAGKNKIYYYVLVAPSLKEQGADTISLLVSTKQVYKKPAMLPVIAVPWDKAITLFWKRSVAARVFTAYYIERSDDNGKTFQQVNRLPYISSENDADRTEWMQYTDSLPENNQKFIYRVKGITAFGEISDPSPLATATGLDKNSPGAPLNVKAENTKGTQVKISWHKNEKEKDFAGYLVGRGNSVNGPFIPLDTVLLPATAEAYIDKYAVPWDKNFYIVAALDAKGNAARSMPAYAIMLDSIAPATPSGLAGTIDSAGRVHLRWAWNKEPDLQGYNLYASNDSRTFYVVNSDRISDSTYMDSITLKTLTRHIYYRICAFDKTGNPSHYSAILKLMKPDIVPPVAQQINHFLITDSSVHFSWVLSSSKDVATQIVWRKEKSNNDWLRIDSLNKDSSQYTDRHVQRLKEYSYSLTAIDSAGLSSPFTLPLQARIYDNGKRKGIDELKVDITEDHRIRLSWKYTSTDRAHISFMVYRDYKNGGFELYKRIGGDQNEFTDSILPGEGAYQYGLKVMTDDGGASAMIRSQKINYEKK